MSLHPRVAVNSISALRQTLAEDLALWADLGIAGMGIISPKLDAPGWDASQKTLRDAGVLVSSVSCQPNQVAQSLEFAGGVGARTLYAVSGSAGGVPWEEAAARYCEAMAPLVTRARELGVRLAVEPTNPLRSDVSFVHTVRDAIDLARMAEIGICIDFYSSWYERGLADLARKNADLLTLVQICDYKIGTLDTPNRVAIGEGDIPIERMIAMMLDAGYEGVFELEILGPKIEAEGYRAPIQRSVERASEILHRLGA